MCPHKTARAVGRTLLGRRYPIARAPHVCCRRRYLGRVSFDGYRQVEGNGVIMYHARSFLYPSGVSNAGSEIQFRGNARIPKTVGSLSTTNDQSQ